MAKRENTVSSFFRCWVAVFFLTQSTKFRDLFLGPQSDYKSTQAEKTTIIITVKHTTKVNGKEIYNELKTKRDTEAASARELEASITDFDGVDEISDMLTYASPIGISA